MSTEPSGWQSPKTNWTPDDNIGASDLNRWEGNCAAIETGERTLDPTQAPSSNKGSLRQILDWLANRIKAITGATNWYDAPATTLAAAKSHMDAAAPHSGHETPSGAQSKVDTHANKNITGSTAVHGIKQGAGNGLNADLLDGGHWVCTIATAVEIGAAQSKTYRLPQEIQGPISVYVSAYDIPVYENKHTATSGAARWVIRHGAHATPPPSGTSLADLIVYNDSSASTAFWVEVYQWQRA